MIAPHPAVTSWKAAAERFLDAWEILQAVDHAARYAVHEATGTNLRDLGVEAHAMPRIVASL